VLHGVVWIVKRLALFFRHVLLFFRHLLLFRLSTNNIADYPLIAQDYLPTNFAPCRDVTGNVTTITCIYHRQTSTMVLRPRKSQPWYSDPRSQFYLCSSHVYRLASGPSGRARISLAHNQIIEIPEPLRRLTCPS
jgi:hypothetical protein